MNSREKGKRGEREFRDELREHGYCKAFRGQQYRGGTDSADVICPELPDIHWEVKRCEKVKLWDWLVQATQDCREGQYRVVAHKKNSEAWVAIVPMYDFLEIVRRSDLPLTGEPSTMPLQGHPSKSLDCQGISGGGKGKADVL